MLSGDSFRHGRRLKVVPQAPLDRVSSSSRELLAMKACEVDAAEASLVGVFRPTSPASSSSSSSSVFSPKLYHGSRKVVAVLRSFLHLFPSPGVSCASGLALLPGRLDRPSSSNRMTGTLFGYRKGHVHFAVQEDPKAHPVLLLELAIPTNSLVKEMASGLVRIALESERMQNRGRLYLEPVWSMYCNGKKTGYAIRRACSEMDLHILNIVKAVSMGAGVLPKEEGSAEGELMYMRARFERVVGSKDSEAFYMMNPDGTGGPELSIFLLRI